MQNVKNYILTFFLLGAFMSCLDAIAQNPGTVSLVSGSQTGCGTISGKLQITGYTGYIEGWQEKWEGGPWQFIGIDGNPPQTRITTPTYNFTTGSNFSYRVAVKSRPNGTTFVYSNEITMTVSPASKGGTLSGSAVYFLSGSGTLQLTGYSGQILNWQKSVDSGSSWTTVAGNSATYTYSGVVQTTQYRAVVQNGTCAVAYSSVATVTVRQPGVISGPEIGGDECPVTLTLQGYYGSIIRWEYSVDGGSVWVQRSQGTSPNYTHIMRADTKFRVLVNMVEGGQQYSPVKSVTLVPYSQVNPVTGLAGQNYIRRQRVVVPVTDPNAVDALPLQNKREDVVYIDGFGKRLQHIYRGTSNTAKDIVEFSVASAGNVATQYLPYVSNESNGAYRSSYLTEQTSFYSNGTADKIADSPFPFAKTVYDQSPLSRVVEKGAQGADWQPGGHTEKIRYLKNSANEVHLFNAEGTSTSFYDPNTLDKVETVDEDGRLTQVFSSMQGQVILRRVQLDENIAGTNTPWLETYYIYNASDEIKYIMTPKGVDAKNKGSWTTHSAQFMNQYMYQFVYDDLGRLIEKKIPGQAWIYYCYDQLDRLVLMQDGYLRNLKKWSFLKYDRLGRVIMQGLYTSSSITNRAQIQQTVIDPLYQSTSEKYYEERGTALHGYTNQSFPKTAADVQIVNYFDDYDFDYDGTNDFAYVPQGLAGEGSAYAADGLVTGKKVLNLATNTWLYNYVFYDNKGRAIQSVGNNHLSSVVDNRITTVYDFEGKPLLIKKYHNAGAGRSTTVLNRYQYDAQGRLLKIYQNNNSAASDQLIAQYVYNELGQLVDKKLHETVKDGGNFVQSVDFRYSIRGWLESINNADLSNSGSRNDDSGDYFGMEFAYNTAVAGLTTADNVYFNGNISASRWRGIGMPAGSDGQHSYSYQYDKANRLKSAVSSVFDGTNWAREQNSQNESATYDQSGNILTLKRNSRQYQSPGAPYGTAAVDDLQYVYGSTAGGDQLLKITDATANPQGFDNGASGTTNDYTYDVGGNLLTDANRGISSGITYNHLGKPTLVKYSDGRKIEYVYDAEGAKLSTKVYGTDGVLKTTTDHVGDFVYENGTLAFFGTAEGRVINKAGVLEYQYGIADNQGNTRVIFSSVNPTQAPAIASFEDAVADGETFENINTSTMYWVSKTAANNTTNGRYVIRMNNTYTTGPAKQLKVFPGDKVSLEVWSYFEGATGFGGSNQPLNALITSVATAFGGVAGGAGESGLIYQGVNSAYSSFGAPPNRGNDVPTAHLNYILFDKKYNVLDMGWEPVPTTANMSKQKISFDEMDIQEAGYMYVYLSYDGEGSNWVYFDDLKITHTQTNVIQYNEYYPYGLLTDASWTREGSKNDFLFNAGSEYNSSTGWYETFFRNYDPASARFLSVDPLAEQIPSLATYQYAANNPVMFNDPRGDIHYSIFTLTMMAYSLDGNAWAWDMLHNYCFAWGIEGSIFPGGAGAGGSGGGGGSAGGGQSSVGVVDFINRAQGSNSFGGTWSNGVATYFSSDVDAAKWALDNINTFSNVEKNASAKLKSVITGINSIHFLYPAIFREKNGSNVSIRRWDEIQQRAVNDDFHFIHNEGDAYAAVLAYQKVAGVEISAILAIDKETGKRGVLVFPWVSNTYDTNNPMISRFRNGYFEAYDDKVYIPLARIHTHPDNYITPSAADKNIAERLGLPSFILTDLNYLRYYPDTSVRGSTYDLTKPVDRVSLFPK